jgi:hypothetical protein
MLRFISLLFLFLVGCQRPVATVLTYATAPVPAVTDGGTSTGKITPGELGRAVAVLQQKLRDRNLPCHVAWDASNQVIIEVFDKNPALAQEIDHFVCMTGTFELRIAANSVDHGKLIDCAKATEDRVVRDEQGELLGWWVPIHEDRRSGLLAQPDIMTREAKGSGSPIAEVLVANDLYRVDGSRLISAAPSLDQTGRPNVTFTLSKTGGQLLGGLTMENLPDKKSGRARRMAIVVNGHVLSAPYIRSAIRERAEITGDFSPEEVQEFANVLNASTLPVRLTRVSIRHVGDQ